MDTVGRSAVTTGRRPAGAACACRYVTLSPFEPLEDAAVPSAQASPVFSASKEDFE